jgi:integrase
VSNVAKPKQSSICCRIRNGRKYYYCWIKGTQHGLGYDREAADAKYRALLNGNSAAESESQPAPEPAAKPSITVAYVLRQFLAWLDKELAAKRLSPGTCNYYRQSLEGKAKKRKSFVPFIDFVGEMSVDEFGEYVVKDWIDTHYAHGSDTYHNTLLRPIKRAFKWATTKQSGRLISENPIDELQITAADSREIEITDAQWAEIEVKAEGPFLDLLIVLKETGARPQELRAAESKHLQSNGGKPRLYFAKPVKKTRGKQKPRKIYLNERAFAICRRLAEQYPTGPLFRNEDCNAWTKNALGCKCKRMKLDFRFFPYALRHKFCTDKLKQGMPPATVAELLGNSVDMVSKVYNQLGLADDYLYQALTA